MAIEWMDNFQNYGTGSAGLSNMEDGLWAFTNTVTYMNIANDPDGVSPGTVLYLGPTAAQPSSGDTAGDKCRRVFPSGAQKTVGIASRWWFTQLPSESARPPKLAFRDGGNLTQLEVLVTTTGVIEVYRGEGQANLVGTSIIPVITAGAWAHVEIKATCDNTTGAVEVRVNGATVINESGVDTQVTGNDTFAQLAWGHTNALSSNWAWYLKDMICWTDQGGAPTDFVGDHDVVTLRTTSDASLNWTPSTGTTGFDLIDEATPDDADYISAADPPPAAAVFELEDLDPEYVSVLALQPTHRSLKTDGGTGNIQTALRVNGVDDLGSDKPMTVTATYWYDISTVDPDSGLSWTPTGVNNAQLVIDRTL